MEWIHTCVRSVLLLILSPKEYCVQVTALKLSSWRRKMYLIGKEEDMKSFVKFILMTAIITTAVSCAKELDPETNHNSDCVTLEFIASADLEEETVVDNDNTKVFYDAETQTTQWKVGDAVKIIAATGNAYDFSVTKVSEDGMSATIKGEVDKSDEESETFYAVYPATAYKGSDLAAPTNETKGARLYIDIPAVQTAVAGTFDPKAFVSIASSNGNVLEFKNLCSVIAFKFNDATDVKSVKFTMVGNTNLASCGNVYVSNLTNHTWGDAFDERSASDMITLNAPAGGFKADTEYYFTLRPFTQSGDTKGFSFYVEYPDHYKVRSNESLNLVAKRNGVKGFGPLDVEGKMAYLPYYDAYTLGFDINVAGKIINKSTFSSATLITNTSASKGLNNNGLYFVTPDASGVTMNSGKSIVVIGNDPSVRSKVSRSGYSYIPATAEDDYWVLSNIDFSISITSATTYTLRLNGSSVCEQLIMNNCSSNVPTATQYIYGDANNKVKEIIIKNSEFLVEPSSTNNFLNFAATQTIDNITFENNVFYSADISTPASSFVLVAAGNTTATNLKLHKNTFYGAYMASGNMTNCKITDAIVTKNLFGLRSDATANVFVVGAKISGTQNFNENGYFKNGASYGVLTVGTSNAGTGTNTSISSIGIDTGLWNPTEGKFVLNNGFGATR